MPDSIVVQFDVESSDAERGARRMADAVGEVAEATANVGDESARAGQEQISFIDELKSKWLEVTAAIGTAAAALAALNDLLQASERRALDVTGRQQLTGASDLGHQQTLDTLAELAGRDPDELAEVVITSRELALAEEVRLQEARQSRDPAVRRAARQQTLGVLEDLEGLPGEGVIQLLAPIAALPGGQAAFRERGFGDEDIRTLAGVGEVLSRHDYEGLRQHLADDFLTEGQAFDIRLQRERRILTRSGYAGEREGATNFFRDLITAAAYHLPDLPLVGNPIASWTGLGPGRQLPYDPAEVRSRIDETVRAGDLLGLTDAKEITGY